MASQWVDLFRVTREKDAREIIFQVERAGNAVGDVRYIARDGRGKECAPPTILHSYLKPTTTFVRGQRPTATVACLADRPITLHVKRDGSVLAKAVLDGHQARINRIHVSVNWLGIPTKLTAYGTHSFCPVFEEIPYF